MKKRKFTILEKTICGALAFLMVCSCPLTVTMVSAALTKGGAVLDSWTTIAANTTAQGAVADVSGGYQNGLFIWGALVNATATTNGLLIRVMGSPSSSGNTTWSQFAQVGMLSGVTAVTQAMSFTAGSTNIVTANTTGYANQSGQPFIYVKDSNITNSEVVEMTTYSANANITALDPITTGHANTTAVWNQVGQAVISIPDWVRRVKVVYDNKQDASGSAVDVMSAIGNITAI